MTTIAKGMITLVNVNDAYSVSITPNVCSIKADFDGSNPNLANACCDINVVCGDIKVPFAIRTITPSHNDIRYNITGDDYNQHLALTFIPCDISSGTVTLEIVTEDEFVTNVVFQYSVMREATMLDWIQDWETNKTSIGSTYLITPKLFVGKKILTEDDLAVLTGVYIGPDSDNGAGIYGLKDGIDIFHLNEAGGVIGGWDISPGGIQTVDGNLQLLSEGSIVSKDAKGNVVWGLYKSGEASFAAGNVKFYSNGNAEFSGKITSTEGEIGGWKINQTSLFIGENVADEGYAEANSMSIGATGIRGHNWRLENDGSGALAKGQIQWGADGALKVGDWVIDKVIKSSTEDSSYISLDAVNQLIKIYNNSITVCSEIEMDCSGFTNMSKGGYSSVITLSAATGLIKASALIAGANNVIPKTYISPYGMYANCAGVKGLDDGAYCHYASIVGIGNASKTAAEWSETGKENCVVGVYGKAINTSSAPAYGGYFENLKACGLVVSKRVITDTAVDADLQIQSNDTLIISVSSNTKTIILPSANIDGKIIIVQQLGIGTLRIKTDPSAGQLLGVPSVGDIYELNQYECVMLILTAYKDTSNALKYAWTINKFNNSSWGN